MAKQVPFIGREDEIIQIRELIEKWGETWLSCIHGEDGGIGKTRLLQEIHSKYSEPANQVLSREDTYSPQITIVQKSAAGDWAQEFNAGVQSMADALGGQCTFFDAHSNSEEMKGILENVIRQKPDALILSDGTADELKPCITEAIQQGIKVLNFGNWLQVDGLCANVMHDVTNGIRSLAERLIQDMDLHGNFAIVRGPGNDIQNSRTGILHDVRQHYPAVNAVETRSIHPLNVTDNTDIETAAYYKTIEILETCQQRAEEINAIWTTWNRFARGVVRALKEKNCRDITVYSFDLSPEDIEILSEPASPWKATVITDPKESGRIMVRLAMQAILEEVIKPGYYLQPRVISQDELRTHRNNESYLTGATEIGWSPLLKSFVQQNKEQRLCVTEIIDFDDHSLRIPENMSRKIAKMLNKLNKKPFEPFFRAQMDYHKMRQKGVNSKRLSQQLLEVNQIFAKCFNAVSRERRVVLFFDTTDELEKGEGAWDDLRAKIPELENVAVLLAGRNAKQIGESVEENIRGHVKIFDLDPLNEDDRRLYFQKKQQQKAITIESDLSEKLLVLSEGRPILLDLVVEWRARGVSLDWLVTESLKDIQVIDKKQRKEFEKHLVDHIRDIRSPMDRLILLMAYIYPLNGDMIARLLKLEKEKAQKLFENATDEKTKYTFVKTFPNDDYVMLHDEMRRMINTYIWPEIDPEDVRRREYSRLVVTYLQDEIQEITEKIEIHKKALFRAEKKERAVLKISLKIGELDQQLWLCREQLLEHTLMTNTEQGVQLFSELFDEAARTHRVSFRQKLFTILQQHASTFSSRQENIRDVYKLKIVFAEKKYEQSKKFSEKILQRRDISSEHRVETLILLGQSKVRLGDVEGGLGYFEEAVNLSETRKLSLWRIKALNSLGRGYRLIGDLDTAREYCQKAQRLCWEEGGPDKRDLKDEYGWISHNLALVLSNDNRTRRTAVNIARSTIKYWQLIENTIGLGAGHLLLGIAYYRADFHQKETLQAFEEASEIFTQLQLDDWLGQIYSWRGAFYQDISKFENAKSDLEKSLRIGPANIKAMTLNRLARVYMSELRWDLAEATMKESLKSAKHIPDYKYWLSSVGRLAAIAAAKGEYDRLDEFEQMLKDTCTQIEYPEKNALGVAYLGLAELALGQNNLNNIDRIIEFLQKGISLVLEFGSYARTDILSRLAFVEEYFNKTNPEIVRSVGKRLQEYISKKEINNVDYSTVAPIMYTWANWRDGVQE